MLGPKGNDVPSSNKSSQASLPCVSLFAAIALRESMKFFSPFLVTLSQNSSSLARRSFSFGSCSRAPFTICQTYIRASVISSSSSLGDMFFLRNLDSFSTACQCFEMFASRFFEGEPLGRGWVYTIISESLNPVALPRSSRAGPRAMIVKIE